MEKPLMTPNVGVGPVLERFSDVKRIAVLRGGGMGDLIYTYPALHAMKNAYPNATITVLGTPIHAAVAAATEGPVDVVEMLPVARGIHDGPRNGERFQDDAEDAAAQDAFIEAMRAKEFDVAFQMHGGGRFSNPFLLRLGARHTVGTRTRDAEPLERNLDYVYYQNEPARWLEVAGLSGAPSIGSPPLRPRPEHQQNIEGMRDPQRTSLVVVHPGATDPRRRWPASYFAEAVAALVREGAQVLIVGDPSEKALAQEVAESAARQLPEVSRSSPGPWPASRTLGTWQLCWRMQQSCSPATVVHGTWPRHWARPRWGSSGWETPSTPAPAGAPCTAFRCRGLRSARAAERTSPRWGGRHRIAATTTL